MPDEPEGAKKPVVLNVVPLLQWLWRTDKVRKLIRKLKRKGAR